MRQFILRAAIVLFMTVWFAPVAGAAQATPVPPSCAIEPLKPDRLEEIVAAGPGDPVSLEPSDQPVSAEVLVELFRVITESVDCANANDPLRSLALYSDRYLATRFAGPAGADELGHLLAAATRNPTPASPSDQLVLLGVTDTFTYADLVVLFETDEGWRIDQVVLDARETSGGTPSASGQD